MKQSTPPQPSETGPLATSPRPKTGQPVELHHLDAAGIKDTLSRMIIEYNAMADLGKEERDRIHFMYVQLADMIDACTLSGEEN